MNTIKAVELMNTWQGEGPDSGRKMTLVRFKDCNRILGVNGLSMCPFCDTAMKLRISTEATYDIEDIQRMVFKTDALMITGGEPTFSYNLENTIKLLNQLLYKVANIETNGFDIIRLCHEIAISPKLENIDIKLIYSPKFFNDVELDEQMNLTEDIIKRNNVYIKLVNSGPLVKDYLQFVSKIHPRSDQVWLMPEGKTMPELIANSGPTIDLCEKYDVNFSSRNHIVFGFI